MTLKAKVVCQSGEGRLRLPFSKLPFLIETILKLAAIKAYDNNNRIRKNDGSYVLNSNVTHLLRHCVTPSQPLVGESEFIELLAEARVDPHAIPNETVKNKLLSGQARHTGLPSVMPSTPRTPYLPERRTFTHVPPPPRKRNVEEIELHETADAPLNTLASYEEPRNQEVILPEKIGNQYGEELEAEDHISKPSNDNNVEQIREENSWQEPFDPVDLSVQQKNADEELEDEQLPFDLSKNRIRPKILVDRDKLKRKIRLKQDRLQHLDLTNIDLNAPMQTRSKRPRWAIPTS